MEPPICEVYTLGILSYRQAWALQKRLAHEAAAGSRQPTLLLLEHPHTFSFGRQGKEEHLLWDEADLARRGVEVVWSDRGGDVTYHGPGQLVGYPILPLAPAAAEAQPENGGHPIPRADYVGYLRRLEKMLIRTLSRFGIAAGQIPGKTGVWIQADVASRCPHCPPASRQKPSKIASIGVRVNARGVSMHGFALNVKPDMAYWEGIVGCGLHGYPVIGMADLLWEPPDMKKVQEAVIETFGQVLGYRMVLEPAGQLLEGIPGINV